MYRPKKYNFTEALQRLRRYCAYQERCHKEVQQKLYDWGFDREDSGRVIVQLMEEKFINEERYAKAIVGGKFRVKGWGKNKIVATLKSKGIVSNLINSSLNEINEEDYANTLQKLLVKKLASLKGETKLVQRQKLARFAMGKGYESELVWKLVNDICA